MLRLGVYATARIAAPFLHRNVLEGDEGINSVFQDSFLVFGKIVDKITLIAYSDEKTKGIRKMIQELNYQNYDAMLHSGKPVVAEFYSQTCAHCKRTEVGLRELSEELGDSVLFAKCDIAAEPSLTAQLDVHSVPTLLFIRNGQIVDKKVGFTHKLIVAEAIKKL